MDRRSAIATAGGVVASFVAGMAAVSLNGGTAATTTAAAAATPAASSARVNPIVKHRTIVVHKKAKGQTGAAPPQRTIVLPAPAPASSAPVTMTGGSAVAGSEPDDGLEHESGGDD